MLQATLALLLDPQIEGPTLTEIYELAPGPDFTVDSVNMHVLCFGARTEPGHHEAIPHDPVSCERLLDTCASEQKFEEGLGF